MKVLFVCLGNICRSPIAEGVLRKYFDLHEIAGEVDSCAITDWNIGKPPDQRAVTVARLNGIDISKHRARQFCIDDCEKFDIIFAMDREIQKSLANSIPPTHHHKVRLLCDNTDIPDPYHGSGETFRHTFEIIDRCCRKYVDLD